MLNTTHKTGGDRLDGAPDFAQQTNFFYDKWFGGDAPRGATPLNTPPVTFEELLTQCEQSIANLLVKVGSL